MESFIGGSSSSTRPIHVYLSFKGDDETCKFTDRLWAALESDDLNTFCDDKKLDPGDSTNLPRHFLKAIQISCVSIVVFSKSYASSIWCLEELSEIAARIHEPRYIVFPVFYDVNPCEVQNQSKSFEKAFAQHENKFSANLRKVHSWRLAMKRVANLSGWDIQYDPWPQVIDDIVREVKKKVHQLVYIDADLVGMQSRVREVEQLLELSTEDAIRVVGICGMGGIGKTTLARVLYDKISHHFDASQFLLNAFEFHIVHGKNNLLVLDGVDIYQSLHPLVQAIDASCLGRGSRIIITTTDEGVLQMFEKYDFYRVKLLTRDEALQLFCRKAFRCDFPLRGYDEELINRALEYADGLPLAIVILGSFLYNRRASEWSTALVEFKKGPNFMVMKVLRRSFRELDLHARETFLDIACFFTGKEIKYVEGILAADLHSHIGTRRPLSVRQLHVKGDIQLLIEKSLVTVIDQKIQMHSLLQEMGRNFVQQEFPSKPEEWSRLWDFNDIYRVMQNETAALNVEAIVLDLEDSQRSPLKVEALSRMNNLKLLIFRNVKFSGVLEHLSKQLKHISWHQYPFTSLPSSFEPYNLRELILPHSCLISIWDKEKVFNSCIADEWEGVKKWDKKKVFNSCIADKLKEVMKSYKENVFNRSIADERKRVDKSYKENVFNRCIADERKRVNKWYIEKVFNRRIADERKRVIKCWPLKNMDLSGSKDLIKLPNLGRFQYLERLELEGCTKLTKLDPSIAFRPWLKFLNLRNCSNLVSIPNDLFCQHSLEMLNLACCSKFAYCLKFCPFEELAEGESIQQSFPCKRQKLYRQKSI